MTFNPFSGNGLLVILIMLVACEKWNLKPESFPEIKTLKFEAGQNPSEAILRGKIVGLLEDDFVDNHGHVWSLGSEPPPSIDNNIGQTTFEKIGNGEFKSELNGLTPGRTYYYRAYIAYDNQIIYGETDTFLAVSPPISLVIDSITLIREEVLLVKVNATISNLPVGLPLQSYGITRGIDSLPEITSNSFVSEQSILAPAQTYSYESEIRIIPGTNYLRPFLLVGDMVYYGNSELFKIDNIWIRKADFGGGGRYNATGFSIGQKGYIGLGINNDLELKSDFWAYDPIDNLWTQIADFEGGPKFSAKGFSIGQKGYIIMGYSSNLEEKGAFWEYDPIYNVWTKRTDFGGKERTVGVAFSIDQMGYAGLGRDSLGSYKNDFWAYDPATDLWTPKADFQGGKRIGGVAFSIDTLGYVGLGGDSLELYKRDFWAYDPSANSWTQKADFGGEPRISAFGFSNGSKGFVGLGAGMGNTVLKDFWEYDPEADIWFKRADFEGVERFTDVGFSIGQRGYVGVGLSSIGRAESDFWEYIPK